MDPIIFRGVERLVIVAGGIILAFLGYKLYRHGITQGVNRMTFESKLGKLLLSGVGPGLFFMAFGAIILITAIYFGGVQTSSATTLNQLGEGEDELHQQSSNAQLAELREQQTKIAAEIKQIRLSSMRLEEMPEPSASANELAALEYRIEKIEAILRKQTDQGATTR